MRKYILQVLLRSFVFLLMLITYAEEQRITLRSSYKDLTVSQVQSMPNISIRSKEDWGFFCHSTINHNYNLKSISGDKVVIDHATGLMWHQHGSDRVSWNKAKEWVRSLNNRGYAGYNDWRLPTLEEAASLLESSNKEYEGYIDPIFSNTVPFIWTGDSKNGSETAWGVDFGLGGVDWYIIGDGYFVRPVRSLKNANMANASNLIVGTWHIMSSGKDIWNGDIQFYESNGDGAYIEKSGKRFPMKWSINGDILVRVYGTHETSCIILEISQTSLSTKCASGVTVLRRVFD